MPSLKQLLKADKYTAKLQSEQWQSFSRSVRKERNFCEVCKRKDVTLQVHHLFYDGSREPWEYGASEVVVLCSGCHQQIHEQLNLFRRFVFGKMTPGVFQILNGALSVAFDKYDPLVFAHALAEFVSTPSMVERYAKAWNMTPYKMGNPYDPESPAHIARTALQMLQDKEKRKC